MLFVQAIYSYFTIFQGFQNGVSIRVKIINVQKTELPRSETLRHRQWNPYLYTIEGSIDSIK